MPDIRNNVDYLTLDYEGFREMMIEGLKKKIPEYTDFSSSDFGIVLIELLAGGLDLLSYYQDRQGLEHFLPTALDRKNVIMHCKQLGYTLYGATPSRYRQVFKIVKQDTDYIIKKGYKVKTLKNDNEPEIVFETDEDLRIDAGKDGTEIDTTTGEYVYSVSITQGITVENEFLGNSDGTADQSFTTYYTPVVEDVIFDSNGNKLYEPKVVVDGAIWERKENFLLSNSNSRTYMYTSDEYGRGVVTFGTGNVGEIPPIGKPIFITYRTGGGSYTNVAPYTITEFDERGASIISTFNPYPAYISGHDRETIAEAKIKAPASLRTLDRAVTLRDYEDLALSLDYIYSAESLLDPITGVVHIYVVPNFPSKSADGKNVLLSSDMLKMLNDYYLNRKMIGQKISIEPAKIREVTLKLKCRAYPNYYNDTVLYEVKNAVEELMLLGKHRLKEGLVLSTIISKILDSNTGVKGLASMIFEAPLNDVAVNGGEILTISDNGVIVSMTGGMDRE